MTQKDKFVYGRWSAGLGLFGEGEGEVVIGAIVDDNEEAPELRAFGRWNIRRGMAPDLGALMDRAIREPIEGRPHLPAIVRVNGAPHGDEIQRVRPEVRCEIGPTPFLDSEMVRLYKELASTEDWRYLDGEATPDAMAALFAAARTFADYPWELADPDAIIRVKLPARGVDGGMTVMADRSATGARVLSIAIAKDSEVIGDWLDDVPSANQIEVLLYERDDLPEAAWREAASHGWTPTEDDLYPRVVVGGDDDERPPSAAELAIATEMLEAVTRFFKDGLAVPDEFAGAASATLVLTSGATADVSVDPEDKLPEGDYDEDEDDEDLDEDEALRLEEEDEAFLELDDQNPWTPAPPPSSATIRAAPKPGRNDECWCGSGKKYKKCHLDADAQSTRH